MGESIESMEGTPNTCRTMSYYEYMNTPMLLSLPPPPSPSSSSPSEFKGQLILPGSDSAMTVDLNATNGNRDQMDNKAGDIVEVKKTEKKTPFKSLLSGEQRRKLYDKVSLRFPGRIPVICEPSVTCSIHMDRVKFICPPDIPLGHFLLTIRKRMPELRPSEAIFLLVDNTSPCNAEEMGVLYDRHKEDDGFLYIKYTTENTFG